MATKKLIKVGAAVTLVIVAAAWLIFSWFEAGKEISVLCSLFEEGQTLAEVERTLETGHYLRYQITETESGQRIDVESIYNLGTTRCIIEVAGDRVISTAYVE